MNESLGDEEFVMISDTSLTVKRHLAKNGTNVSGDYEHDPYTGYSELCRKTRTT